MTSSVLDFIRQLATKEASIRSVILFGSRARGDHHERSDYDIAVDAPSMSDDAWARFAEAVREKSPTLCGIDIVRITRDMSAELRQKIQAEGQPIYELK